ncbi:MAG: 4Fe-4S binding protein, partial [Caldilineales bacterium]|nr:4Fe-4S binding protein [Caldilineales bacterium]
MSAPFSCHRRRFLQWVGGALVWLGLERLATDRRVAAATRGPESDYAWAVLVDLTRCTGCNRCALACKTA